MFLETDEQNLDLVVLSLEGSPEPLLATEFSERNGEISPDGLWLAYESEASGQYEIYVRPFPNVEDGQWPISRGGGTRPLWSPDSRELFYLAPGARLMAVGVQTEPSFAPGNAEEVFGGYYATSTLKSSSPCWTLCSTTRWISPPTITLLPTFGNRGSRSTTS